MAYTYFNDKYQLYYNQLKGNEAMIGNAISLSDACKNHYNQINSSYFSKITDSKWEELGKSIVKNNIIVGLRNNINIVSNFINNNLVKACTISISSLLPKVEEIKIEDEKLQKLQNELNSLCTELNSTSKTKSTTYKDINGENHITTVSNPRYYELVRLVQTKENEIVEKHNYLKNCCAEANDFIAQILILNGNLSIAQINTMLPDYDIDMLLTNLDFESILNDNLLTYEYIDENGNVTVYDLIAPLAKYGGAENFVMFIKALGLYNESPGSNPIGNFMGKKCDTIANAYAMILLDNPMIYKKDGTEVSGRETLERLYEEWNKFTDEEQKEYLRQNTYSEPFQSIRKEKEKWGIVGGENRGRLDEKFVEFNKEAFAFSSTLVTKVSDTGSSKIMPKHFDESIKGSFNRKNIDLLLKGMSWGVENDNPARVCLTKGSTRTDGDGQHYGNIIGIRQGAQEPYVEEDFLYIDTFDGEIKRLGTDRDLEAMVKNGGRENALVVYGFECDKNGVTILPEQ